MKVKCIIGVVSKPKVELTLADDRDLKLLAKYNINKANFIAHSNLATSDLTGRHGIIVLRPTKVQYEKDGVIISGYRMNIMDIIL